MGYLDVASALYGSCIPSYLDIRKSLIIKRKLHRSVMNVPASVSQERDHPSVTSTAHEYVLVVLNILLFHSQCTVRSSDNDSKTDHHSDVVETETQRYGDAE